MPQPKPQYRANKKYIKKTLKKVDRKQPVPQTTGFFYYDTQPPKTQEKFSVTTSKLEDTFALYLKSLNIKYERQFKLCGFYYDFVLIGDGGDIVCLVEVDGGYYHTDPRIYSNGPINEGQRRQKFRDEAKNKAASISGYKLERFWEKDILHNKRHVIDRLKKIMGK